MPKHSRHQAVLRTIAVLKFLKVAFLVVVGVAMLKLIHHDVGLFAVNVVDRLHIDPGNQHVSQALGHVSNVTPNRLKEFGAVSFVYAGLFLTEGIGLWTLRRWGQWMTVIITGSLLPIEVYEVIHRATILKVGTLLVNAAILGYLIWHVRTHKEAPAD